MVAVSAPVLIPAAAPPVIITLVSIIIFSASISLLCSLSPVVVLVIVAGRRPPVLIVTVSAVVDMADTVTEPVAAMSSVVETERTAIIDPRCGLVGRSGDTKIHTNPVSIQFHSIHSFTCLFRFCDCFKIDECKTPGYLGWFIYYQCHPFNLSKLSKM